MIKRVKNIVPKGEMKLHHQVNNGCEHRSHGGAGPSWHHGHCCCGQDMPHRRFPTKQETQEELTEYLKQLKAEAKDVEERLADLETES